MSRIHEQSVAYCARSVAGICPGRASGGAASGDAHAVDLKISRNNTGAHSESGEAVGVDN